MTYHWWPLFVASLLSSYESMWWYGDLIQYSPVWIAGANEGRWWSDRFSGSGHNWQSWRSMAANSLKATLPSLQSTKVPRDLVLTTENECEHIFFPRFARNDRRYAHLFHCLRQRHRSDLSAAPPLGSFRRPWTSQIFHRFQVVSCPDPTHVRARGSGYTSPNPWARFRMLKRPMRSQSGVY